MKTCSECGGKIKRKLITYDERWEDILYTFTEVPAWICETCNEEYLEGKALEEIEKIIQTHQTPERYDKVPVYSLNKLGLVLT